MCVHILWVYIGSEFAVLAVSLSLGRQKTDVVQFNTAESHYSQPQYMVFLPFVTTHFNTAVLTVRDLFQLIKVSPPAWQASSFTLLLLYRSVLGSVKLFLLLN